LKSVLWRAAAMIALEEVDLSGIHPELEFVVALVSLAVLDGMCCAAAIRIAANRSAAPPRKT
jgi:hypothetical protein